MFKNRNRELQGPTSKNKEENFPFVVCSDLLFEFLSTSMSPLQENMSLQRGEMSERFLPHGENSR